MATRDYTDEGAEITPRPRTLTRNHTFPQRAERKVHIPQSIRGLPQQIPPGSRDLPTQSDRIPKLEVQPETALAARRSQEYLSEDLPRTRRGRCRRRSAGKTGLRGQDWRGNSHLARKTRPASAREIASLRSTACPNRPMFPEHTDATSNAKAPRHDRRHGILSVLGGVPTRCRVVHT